MSRATRIAGLLAFCLIAGCSRHAARREPVIAPSEAPILAQTEKRGQQIYTQDLYAAQATSLLLAHGVDPARIGTRGWITEGRQDGAVVTFVGGDPVQWQSVCVVAFSEPAEPNIILVDRDLSETQSAMFNARQLVLDSVEKPCSDAYNTVVIPRDGEPGWLAYALAATNDPNLILIGGHYRATVSADGRTVLERRSFTSNCLVLRKNPKDMPPGAEPEAYTMSHLLDDTPTEIHVFLNLLYGKPLYVVTRDDRLWYIEGGKVSILKHP
jgi:nucleotide-binding universal stress UspA family protein